MDYKKFINEWETYNAWYKDNKEDLFDRVLEFPNIREDRVNSPSHYTSGGREVIRLRMQLKMHQHQSRGCCKLKC